MVLQLRLVPSAFGSYASIGGVLIGFHALYGLSGPIAVILGGALPAVFSVPYALNPFLVALGLATLGLTLAMLVMTDMGALGRSGEVLPLPLDPVPAARAAIAFGVLASAMEAINLWRAGGVALLALGKGVFQTATSDVRLALPASQCALVAVGLAGIALAGSRTLAADDGRRTLVRRGAALTLIALLPMMSVLVILGQRGLLLEWFSALLIASTYRLPVRHLSARFLIVGAVFYSVAGVIYANRAFLGLAVTTGDWSDVVQRGFTPERIAFALNPSVNEFGVPLGNYSEYRVQGPLPLRYGETYVTALASPVPRFLYPTAKPQQFGYEFRDRFFHEQANESAIAGTGLSSILEAEANFGALGPLVIYLLFGLLVGALERWRWRSDSPPVALYYLLVVPAAVYLHRSDFDLVVGEAVVGGVVALGAGAALVVWSVTRPAARFS
jgi:hypothetical protein